ncbi:MAG TPA: NAD-dependent epimerase/dehydratase family protein, partial [Angustibacter sp.]|nr:NAD-dependent epimerase/dehydratase family protein [Angustibacter sp.]
MKVAVTGAAGFLGWHLRLRLRALAPDVEVVAVDRSSSAEQLERSLAGADVVLHCAGVNRASDDEVQHGNVALAESLVDALRRSGSAASVVYADSIQAGTDSPYGRGKQAAADVLASWGEEAGRSVADVRLPNLYGEHGRPGYNSFVATFAHRIAAGESPSVDVDRPVPLLHVQDAAQVLIDSWRNGTTGRVDPAPARVAGVAEVRDLLQSFFTVYSKDGSIPTLRDRFDVTMFNTLRAAMFPAAYPFQPTPHSDARGTLVESVRVHGGQGQTFVSTTVPGQRRGDHFHLDKIERFQVVRGRGLIRLRRVLTDEYVEFLVDGDEPAVVDMPTGWAHSIENVGEGELMTLFWAHELFDP